MQILKCFRVAHGHFLFNPEVWGIKLTSLHTAGSILDCPGMQGERVPQEDGERERGQPSRCHIVCSPCGQMNTVLTRPACLCVCPFDTEKNKAAFRWLEASLSAGEVSTVDANCVFPHGFQICFNKNVKHSWFLKLWGAFEVTYIGGDNILIISCPPQCLAQGFAQSLWA